VETAKAFGTPVLEGGRSGGATAEGIAQSEAGREVVRYGEVGAKGELRLRFGRREEVMEPVGGRIYS